MTYAGSLGCLVMSVERGLLTLAHANDLLVEMISQGYYAPLTDLSALIKP